MFVQICAIYLQLYKYIFLSSITLLVEVYLEICSANIVFFVQTF